MRSITVHISPLGILAAAPLVVAVTLGAFHSRPSPASNAAPTTVVQGPPDTVTFVRFVFVGRAKSVSLVGDFNAWGATPAPLVADGVNGAWTASVPVPKGRHEYAFIVDGKRWVPDPFAPASSDDFDTHSSIITVGD